MCTNLTKFHLTPKRHSLRWRFWTLGKFLKIQIYLIFFLILLWTRFFQEVCGDIYIYIYYFFLDEVKKRYGIIKISANFEQALGNCEWSNFCLKLPKIAQIYQNLPKDETLKFHQKSIKIPLYRRGNRACFHRLDFQSKNFSYAIFIVKKRPLYVNFSKSLVEIDDFLKVLHLA